ncbi:MAG TPA: hypothetical protein VHH88_02225, partial [Verrucomicrobiae bacterium]|nr:hypothetical protein [Verrucomicrobiae bacterium]
LGRQLQDWFKQRRGAGLDPAQFEIVASGGAFEQPGFLEHLKSRMELPVRRWADGAEARGGLPERGFEPAYGLALQALGFAARPVSLLPQDYQARWSKRLSRERIEVASLVLVFVCALMLGLGTWRHAVLAVHKKALLEKVSAGQTAADANDALSSELVSEFETFRPVFAAQQKTIDLLSSLALLQEARGTQSYWYVLLADEQSYFLAPTPEPPPGATNKTAKPSASAASSMTVRASVPTAPAGASLPGVSDAPPSRPGLIAELAIPSDPEAARVTLSQLVKDLKQKPMFAKVDLLSEDLKRNLADPKVTLPGKDFVLALDFAATNYVQPVASRRRMPFNSRPSGRHPAWPANATPASSQKGMP